MADVVRQLDLEPSFRTDSVEECHRRMRRIGCAIPSDECAVILAGVAAWMVRILEEACGYPVTWFIDEEPSSASINTPIVQASRSFSPEVSVVSGVRNKFAGAIVIIPPREDDLVKLLDVWIERRPARPGEAHVPEGLADPEVLFEDELLEPWEVEIAFDPGVEWDRRRRFEQLLASQPQFLGFVMNDDIEAVIVSRHDGPNDEFAAMVKALWNESEFDR